MAIVETVVSPTKPEDDFDILMDGEQDQPAEQSSDQERGRSTIQFPYLDLEDAIAIATGVHSVGGNSCQIDQLAAHLQQGADAPKFRQKLGTSKMFGLITYGQGTVALTPLGRSICDPQQVQAAKAEAFLKIPLYDAVYEQFKGGNLPPMAGLETAMETLGVAPKQKRNARLAFIRSANQAGYFAFGPSRLVKPAIKNGGGAHTPAAEGNVVAESAPKHQEKPKEKNGDDGGGGDQHPFIQGLIKTLPKTDGPWPVGKRAQWLQAAVSVFNLIYTDDGSGGRIDVNVQKESA